MLKSKKYIHEKVWKYKDGKIDFVILFHRDTTEKRTLSTLQKKGFSTLCSAIFCLNLCGEKGGYFRCKCEKEAKFLNKLI
jgi:hypothetical protein